MVKKLIIILALVMFNTVAMADVATDLKNLENSAKALVGSDGKVTDPAALQALLKEAAGKGLKDGNLLFALKDAGVSINDAIVAMGSTFRQNSLRLSSAVAIVYNFRDMSADEQAAAKEQVKNGLIEIGVPEARAARDAGKTTRSGLMKNSTWANYNKTYAARGKAFGAKLTTLVAGSPLRIDPTTGNLRVSPS